MPSLFPPDRLVPRETFEDRLRSLLGEALEALGLTHIAIAELAAPDGQLTPTWRAWCPDPRPDALTLEVLEALGADPGLRHAGAPFPGVDTSWRACPLAIEPRMGGVDTLLVIAGDPLPGDEALSELCACLEQGLSHDRRERRERIVCAAIEQAPDPIEITDRHARLLFANEAWGALFGYTPQQVVGRTVGSLFRARQEPLHDRAFYQFTLSTLFEDHSWLGALACRTHDGGQVFCEVNVGPFAATEQDFCGNVAVRRDLAHRAERDEALAIAHREFRIVLSAIPDGVVVLRDELIYFANEAFTAMVGLDEAQVVGRRYDSFVHPDDRSTFLETYEREVARVRIVSSDGRPRFAEISTAGEVSFEGRASTILLSRDTTSYRIAQEQLARAERMSALGSLAAGIAHEINNPLAYVIGNLGVLRSGHAGRLDPGDAEILDEALHGATRIHRIVTDLHAFSGSDPGFPEPVDVDKAITSALNIAQNEIRHRARLRRRGDLGTLVMGREGPLVQVLVSVLVNAAQAIPELDDREHRIEIGVRRTAAEITIVVSDTGVGISEEALPRVFDPFFTSKPRREGSGLGLSIAKQIVEDFGGSIHIESLQGLGTKVRISLPSAPDARPTSDRSQPPRGNTTPARLLIIDDEPAILRVLGRILPEHDLTCVPNGHAALELLSGGAHFDVILCDLMMPQLSGSELYRRVRRHRPELAARFVFMTGGAFTESSSDFLEVSELPVVEKPFEVDTLRSLVNAVAEASVHPDPVDP